MNDVVGGIGDLATSLLAIAIFLTAVPVAVFFAMFMRKSTRRKRGAARRGAIALASLGLAASCFAVYGSAALQGALKGPRHFFEHVVDSYPIASFTPEQVGLHVEGRGAESFIYSTSSQDEGRSERYVVLADPEGDGGLTRRDFPADDVSVYRDSEEGMALVEVVYVWSVCDESPFGLKIRQEFPNAETRIHVPAGTMIQSAL